MNPKLVASASPHHAMVKNAVRKKIKYHIVNLRKDIAEKTVSLINKIPYSSRDFQMAARLINTIIKGAKERKWQQREKLVA